MIDLNTEKIIIYKYFEKANQYFIIYFIIFLSLLINIIDLNNYFS